MGGRGEKCCSVKRKSPVRVGQAGTGGGEHAAWLRKPGVAFERRGERLAGCCCSSLLELALPPVGGLLGDEQPFRVGTASCGWPAG